MFYWRALTSLTVHTNPTLSSDVDQDTYTAQLKFSTDFNIMPHFQWTWTILFDVINMYGDLEINVFLCPPDKR